MQIFRGEIELLDYVFYATVERGKVYETGSFIHNYALAYALGLVRSETYIYARLVQEPHYVEELTPLNQWLYLTPGRAERIAHRLVQWNTLREGYAFPGKPPSLGYPDWGFVRMLRPGCRFQFFVMVHDLNLLPKAPALQGLLSGKAVRARLGKFSAKARLRLEPAISVSERRGPFVCSTLLNWRDLEADPVACDVLATSLPTRLLSQAHFTDSPYMEAKFRNDTVQLPTQMRFLARQPELKRRKGKS
jgi:CRISPR-associated protein Csc1